jgi:hypothetical protein
LPLFACLSAAAVLDPAAAMLQQHLGQAEARLRSGPFAVGVRELLGYYMSLEELYLEDTTDMAIRIDEVVSSGLSAVMPVWIQLRRPSRVDLCVALIETMCCCPCLLEPVQQGKGWAALLHCLSPAAGHPHP